jgi:hypothetical protein
MVFHGAVVLLLGLLSGLPFGRSLVAGWSDEAVRSWRVAHAGLVALGLLLIALAPALRYLVLGRRAAAWLVGSAVASAYAFAFALLLGGLAGVRGLQPAGPVVNLVAFASNVVGVCGSLLCVALTLRGAYGGLRRPAAD